jgi:hypothetical protein
MAHHYTHPGDLPGHYDMDPKDYPSQYTTHVGAEQVDHDHSSTPFYNPDNGYNPGNVYNTGSAYAEAGCSTPTPIVNPPSVRPRVKSWFAKAWIMEILAAVASVILLVVLVVFLRVYDGKTMTHWPAGITINTIVAAISMVIRVAFMFMVGSVLSQGSWNWVSGSKRSASRLSDLELFDSASRGAWGSLKLLWRLKGL